MNNIFPYGLREGDSDKPTSECTVCQEDGACLEWAQTMADDADVPVEWIAARILDGSIDCGWSTEAVYDGWYEEIALEKP